jgi:predicted metalloendopeptidase
MGIGTADWGQLGGLLGHEMSHGFDNVGRLFGPDLVIKSWWDKTTTAR